MGLFHPLLILGPAALCRLLGHRRTLDYWGPDAELVVTCTRCGTVVER